MRFFLLSTLLFLLSTFSLSAQQMQTPKITLPLLQLTNKAVAESLEEVSRYISSKAKGMNFPVSKAKFVKVKGGYSIEIEGIDNSWRNLFKRGEVSYGYAVVLNRLFVIIGNANEDIDLRDVFIKEGTPKSFNKMHLPSTLVDKNPKWYFEYVDGVSTKVREEDLDILGK